KKLFSHLLSNQMYLFALAIFIVVIGAATIIENNYDTVTAKLLIYHAWWFELLMLYLIVLFILKVIREGFDIKKKYPHLVFHFSFILLFIGGGVTRHFGYEGTIHIIENEAVNVLYTAKPYFQVRVPEEQAEFTSKDPLYFSQLQDNDFHFEFKVKEGASLTVDYLDYIFYAKKSKVKEESDSGDFNYIPGTDRESDQDALYVNLTWKGKPYKTVLLYQDTLYIQPFRKFNFDGTILELTYGPKPRQLPFSIKLKDFKLSKYPGTAIPSASESRVVLIDERNSDVAEKEYIIAKNQVLDYDGYRFFQTSYDDDEKGTILSVNYDYYGTRITYLGYIFMTLGSILILVSKNSLFSKLDSKIKEVRAKRKAIILTAFFVAGTCTAGYSQKPIQKPISHDHAENFGQLLVQTYDGRFSTVHSLAIDVIHKISAKDKVNISGKGEMDAMHLFMDIVVDPDFWKDQNIIIVREKALRKMLGISGKHASFNQFFYPNNDYKLEKTVKNAYKKKASEQTALDRELIRV
ncbi:MAG: cytochrome c biogenesis protein ResB, partial [Cyclobacteriaceae bacterium]|nr:cytochrome c biogenesis protein ResB [Cyclobacteriaceae bacterium]